jgi:Putative peptidoglycan binding domain
MTPLRARITLFAIMAVFLATAGNALFLQEHRAFRHGEDAGKLLLDSALPAVGPKPAFIAGPHTESAEVRLHSALQRELSKHGYSDQLNVPVHGLKLAVLAYQFDSGLTLTGQPSEVLLKRLLFDLNQAPKGTFADRAEANQQLVTEVQNMLLGLGFFRGALSGRIDEWTEGAVREFERHQGLTPSGRLTPRVLLELINYSGHPVLLSSK